MPAKEYCGTARFIVPGLSKPCYTWYKVVGNLDSDQVPIVALHGGPGACHESLLPLTDLDIPIVFYDQIGNGKSTHLREKNGDTSFWTVQLFLDELNNLLRHLGLDSRPIDVLGQSWGGMLGAEWAVSPHCKNLRKLVLANTLASIEVWLKGIHRLRDKLPAKERDAIAKAEETGDFMTPEYEAAIDVFYQRHMSLTRPWPPPEVKVAMDWLKTDNTTYSTMYGPSEVSVTGSLRDWTVIPRLGRITAPTLLINGVQDEAQDVAMLPFFENIKNVKWITLDNAAHMSHVDQRERYMWHLKRFLNGED